MMLSLPTADRRLLFLVAVAAAATAASSSFNGVYADVARVPKERDALLAFKQRPLGPPLVNVVMEARARLASGEESGAAT